MLASTDPSQDDVTAMIVELSTAMAEIRLVPDKSKLEDLIAKTEGSTDATVKALRTQAIALLANDLATQEEVDALVEELEVAIENAGKPSGGNSSSGNKGSSSSNTSGGNVYAGEGTAVVTSSASVVTAAKSVVSDTTAPFVFEERQRILLQDDSRQRQHGNAELHGWQRQRAQDAVCGEGWQRLLLPRLCDRNAGPEHGRLHADAGRSAGPPVCGYHWISSFRDTIERSSNIFEAMGSPGIPGTSLFL